MSYSNNMECKDIVALDVIYKKKYVFGLCPHFWHRDPKSLGISLVIRAINISFVMLMRRFGGWSQPCY